LVPLGFTPWGGKWYVVVIVDDYSRYSWVFFLKSKDEAFDHFQSLALRMNNEHPNCLKAIHNDNGTEFRNTTFNYFALSMALISSFLPRVYLNIMESWNEITAL
jgi:IS30 family transposase